MTDWQQRTELLIGKEALSKLSNQTVAVIGLGGVGGMCAEALCRAGIGTLILMDYDVVDCTNLNRQIFATLDWVGKPKTEAAAARLKSIAPNCEIILINEMYSENTRELLLSRQPEYVADAIDMITAKIDLITNCIDRNIPVISCMGAGNRLDPSAFKVADIYETSGCGLARTMRRELRNRGVKSLKTVCSTELPVKSVANSENGRHSPASISFCPPAAGLVMAGAIVNDIIK